MAESVIGYEIKVKGQYFARDGKDRTIRFYGPLTFYLPEVVEYVAGRKQIVHKSPEGVVRKETIPLLKKANGIKIARFMIKNYFLGPALKDLHEDYIKYRTYEIVSKKKVKLTGKLLPKSLSPKNIDSMGECDLLQFCAIQDLKVVLTNYSDLADRKMAVTQAYKAKQAQKKELKKATAGSGDEDLNEPTDVSIKDETEDGVLVVTGAMNPDDEMPTDEQDAAEDLL